MSHWYHTPLDRDGEKRASYTTWLSVVDSPWFAPGAAKQQTKILVDAWWEAYQGLTRFETKEDLEKYVASLQSYKDNWDYKASGGSFAHNAHDAFVKGLFDGDEEDYLLFLSEYYDDPAWIQYVSAIFRAFRENNIKIVDSEMTVWNTDGGAGTLDNTGIFDDAFGVIDKKVTPYPIGWKAWAQTEGYRRAYTFVTRREPVFRMIIRACAEENKLGLYEILIRPLQINTQIRIWYKYNRKTKKYELTRDFKTFSCDHEDDYKALLACKTIFERTQK